MPTQENGSGNFEQTSQIRLKIHTCLYEGRKTCHASCDSTAEDGYEAIRHIDPFEYQSTASLSLAGEGIMKFEKAMRRYTGELTRAANDAFLDGLGSMDVVQGLAGTLAASVRSAGGDNTDIANAFHGLGESFDRCSS